MKYRFGWTNIEHRFDMLISNEISIDKILSND